MRGSRRRRGTCRSNLGVRFIPHGGARIGLARSPRAPDRGRARAEHELAAGLMERRAKERLIGAGILVALAVIVVPELLSGPKQEAVRPDATMELPRPQ